jgi:chemosensory pili system protein ChpA (sensor histidine kinase/response regulator)
MPETKVVGGLKWVKGELIDSLRRVRKQLEAFVAGGGSSDCGDGITVLYEVRGVLLALQMTAPARLTEEMQRLLERLVAGSLANPDEAAEALMLALVQLPHYLDEVDAGRGESPVTLLPSINDLRVSRGARALSAAQLVVPSSVLSELESPTPDALRALAAVAAKVRPHFHRYLLLAFRGDGEQGLTGLGNLFHQLHRFFKEGVFCDTFRAAEAMSAGILDGGIPVTPASKAALGHIDSVFKPLLQRDPAWPEMQARQLIGELLPYLIELDPDSALVQTLDAEYRPRREATGGEGGRPETRALGADAIASLTAEVLRELAVVKDHFDLFVRGGGVAPEQVAPMEASLHQLANAMTIGEDPSLVSRFHYLADALGQLAGGDLEGDDAFYLKFAQELLVLEDALRRAVPGDEGRSAGSQAALFALREARADLEKGRQAIADYPLDPGDLRRLRDAQDILPGVAAALHRVGEDAAADILDGVVSLLRQRFTEGGRGPRAGELDRLAEAVAGVEMHIEGLAQGAPFGLDILSQARSALEGLGSGAESRAAAEQDRLGLDTGQLLLADTEAVPPV